jgi:hypothetical protein
MAGRCDSASAARTVEVELSAPGHGRATAATFLIHYPNRSVGLPGEGMAASVQQRILRRQPGASYFANDLGDAIRIVAQATGGLTQKPLLAVSFDDCSGQTPRPDQFGCLVEGCADEFGLIEGCACSIVVP